MSISGGPGRFANGVIRSIAMSLVAEKNNLHVTYERAEKYQQLGLPLYCGGGGGGGTTRSLDDDYFIKIMTENICDLTTNLDPNGAYFQSEKVIQYIYAYLQRDEVRRSIRAANPHADRYNNNCDVYVHVRLGDEVYLNPGFNYYDVCISSIAEVETIGQVFISSDTIIHPICQKIIQKYGACVVDKDEVETLQFASTCKYIIMSNGTYSALMGYLAYDAECCIYPQMREKWHGEVFSIPAWRMVPVSKYLDKETPIIPPHKKFCPLETY